MLADLGERRAVVRVAVPPEVRLGLPHALAVRALGPVVDNAARHGQSVRVTCWVRAAGGVLVAVDDDGDGVAPEAREVIFEPGHTSAPRHGQASGAGLGLALARRIARSAGGDVRLGET